MFLVCGATGLLGGLIARRLAAQDVPLRLLLRSGAGDPLAAELGAEAVYGDFRDRASLDAAVRGATTVISSATAMSRALSGERLGPQKIDGEGTLALVDAAERAGVERFVFVSFAGLDDELATRFPLAAAKLAVERRLEASPMRHVVLRPDLYQEIWLGPLTGFDWQSGQVIVYGRGENPARYVAARDVAEAVARLAVAPDPPPVIEFGGPEALTRHQAVASFEAATGRPIRVRHVPRAALRVGARVLRRPRPALASVMGLSLHTDTAEARWTDAPLRALGIEPRGVAEYADQVAGRAASPTGQETPVPPSPQ
jgi:NADH dehydrogenase